jgi:sugar phosphate isomerase/epimerase
MHFGVSTHLFHDWRLEREHLMQVAAHGFDVVEVFATRTHFDYQDAGAVARLAEWLSDAGLRLHSVHAPICERFHEAPAGTLYSTAFADNAKRLAAVHEVESALQLAKHIPFDTLVVHLGTPSAVKGPGDNSRAAALKSAEEICRLAEPFGVRVAFELIPNDLSSAAALVSMLERDLDAPAAGICLDFGHAHLMGDVADAVELAAEHLIATHVHDNRGRSDEHLVPFRGSINWDTVLLTMQKIGYEGPYMMEVASIGPPGDVLEDARRARERFERVLTHA